MDLDETREDISDNLQAIDDFLLSDAVSMDAMLVSEFDGLIAGVIVCPDLIPPSEWLPLVWGPEEPLFESEAQAQEIIGRIMGHYNDTIHSCEAGSYAPVFDIDNDDSALWQIWLGGFQQALQLRPDVWASHYETFDDDLQGTFSIVMDLGMLAEEFPLPESLSDREQELIKLAPAFLGIAVQSLFNARIGFEGRVRPFRRKKIGRNDPCPCGSGKKYKNCCLN